MWVVFVIVGRKQGGWVGFKQVVIDGDGCYIYIDDSGVMIGSGYQCIVNCQYDSVQYDDMFGIQYFIIQLVVNGDEVINQCVKGGEQSNGICF